MLRRYIARWFRPVQSLEVLFLADKNKYRDNINFSFLYLQLETDNDQLIFVDELSIFNDNYNINIEFTS